jgi:very-short-patch-repair endonuclease
MPHPKILNKFAGQNRKQMTPAEWRLWQALRGKKFHGLKFRRQEPIENFIVDFVCYEKRLIVELDGYSHTIDTIYTRDIVRDQTLNEAGFKALRFTNADIETDVDQILSAIANAMLPPPQK